MAVGRFDMDEDRDEDPGDHRDNVRRVVFRVHARQAFGEEPVAASGPRSSRRSCSTSTRPGRTSKRCTGETRPTPPEILIEAHLDDLEEHGRLKGTNHSRSPFDNGW